MADLLAKQLEAWNFTLPERLIARHGIPDREQARLLLVKTGRPIRQGPPDSVAISEHCIFDLPKLLSSDDLLIANNTRVSKRRIRLQRQSGAKLEALFLSPLRGQNSSWLCLLRNQRKAKAEELLFLEGFSTDRKNEIPFFRFSPVNTNKTNASKTEDLQAANAVLTALNPKSKTPAWRDTQETENFFEQFGELPLPPYLHRQAEKEDESRYQTVFCKAPSSVAAPTAGLHFTAELIQKLQKKGISLSYLHLQIGYGTFAPITPRQWQEKRLHRESFEIPQNTAQKIRTHKGRLIAIGTTSLRALEASHQSLLAESPKLAQSQKIKEGLQSTDLFLYPPKHPHLVDGLLTNFHLPKSSLLLLVGSILGHKNTMQCYQYAIEKEFRFFSYGDAMLILP